MSTKILPVTDLRRRTSAVIRGVQEDGDVVYITQHGRPAAVILDYEQYETLVTRAQKKEWPDGYFTRTYGALADEPLSRSEQGEFEERDVLS